jgi:rubrerythrin
MNLKILLASFFLVFIAELGDKTQLTALAFTTSSRSPWMVFIGTSLALITTSALAVLLGDFLTRVVPVKVLHISSGVLFVLMGLILLVNVARKAESKPVVPTVEERSEKPAGAVSLPTGLVAFVASQAQTFEQDMLGHLETLLASLPEGKWKDVIGDIVREDRKHLNLLSRMAHDHPPAAESDEQALAGLEPPRWTASPLAADSEETAALDEPALRDAIGTAVESEEALAEFYLALARMAKIHAVRDAFRLLAMEDIRHAQSMCSLINPDEEPV